MVVTIFQTHCDSLSFPSPPYYSRREKIFFFFCVLEVKVMSDDCPLRLHFSLYSC